MLTLLSVQPRGKHCIIVLNKVKLSYILILLKSCISSTFVGHLFPLVTSLNRVGLVLNLKISILQIFFNIYLLVIA